MNSSDESDSDDIEYYKLMNRALKNQINQLEQTLANQNQDSLIKKNHKRFEYINQNCYKKRILNLLTSQRELIPILLNILRRVDDLARENNDSQL